MLGSLHILGSAKINAEMRRHSTTIAARNRSDRRKLLCGMVCTLIFDAQQYSGRGTPRKKWHEASTHLAPALFFSNPIDGRNAQTADPD